LVVTDSMRVAQAVETAFERFTTHIAEPYAGYIAGAFLSGGKYKEAIRDAFAKVLAGSIWKEAEVRMQFLWGSGRYDISIRQGDEVGAVMDVMGATTNEDGVRDKTRKIEHLPKDSV
jgi:hypothetical protein